MRRPSASEADSKSRRFVTKPEASGRSAITLNLPARGAIPSDSRVEIVGKIGGGAAGAAAGWKGEEESAAGDLIHSLCYVEGYPVWELLTVEANRSRQPSPF